MTAHPPAGSRLCLYGLTGCGKSTVAAMLVQEVRSQGRTVAVVKLADPLYRLQHEFYRVARLPDPEGRQDQVLLETIAVQLRRISPTSLADDLEARLAEIDAEVVVNDDLRDPHHDHPRLRALGFRFVRVVADEQVRVGRLRSRADLSTVADSESTRELDLVRPERVLDNSGDDLTALREHVVSTLLDLV